MLTHSNFVELTAATPRSRIKEVVPTPARRPCSSSRPRTSSRGSSPCSAVHAGVKRRPPARHQAAPPLAQQLQADLPARGAARLREGLQLGGAEGGGRRQGQDLPRRRRHRRRLLEGARRPARCRSASGDQVHALRPARLRQAPARDGRQREVRRLRIPRRSARASATSSTPRHHDPRGLRPHRDHRARHGQPRHAVEDRHGRPGAARRRPCGSPTTARSWSRASTSSRRTGRTRRPRRTRSSGDWFKTGDLGSLRRRGLPLDHRPQEGDHRHGRRQERRARRPRGPDPRRTRSSARWSSSATRSRSSPRSSRSTPRCCPVWLNNNGEDADMSVDEASVNPAVLAEVQRAIDAANENVSRAESIRKFTILATELTEASGHLTPKMSIKRNVILEDFCGQYRGDVLGRTGHRGPLDRALIVPTTKGPAASVGPFVMSAAGRALPVPCAIRTSPPRAPPSSPRAARPSRGPRGRGCRRGGRSRAAAPAP